MKTERELLQRWRRIEDRKRTVAEMARELKTERELRDGRDGERTVAEMADEAEMAVAEDAPCFRLRLPSSSDKDMAGSMGADSINISPVEIKLRLTSYQLF
ncbi:hypothetical protein RRG08_037164 [Elysia crispata]|uniref:Uncharacterized protein n=1 Tax=Elysia crispata TaxID=231223 RepID=A0AAE0ZPA7_9GAST|nr:hypothetical protein RRG08_037164 [Elysia crispata]